MSNRTSRPAPAPQPAPSTDRPTATYPTNPFAGWRDRTPTGHMPPVAAAAPAPFEPGQAAPAEPSPAVQDMGRPGLLARPSMRWHPSRMQLAIGAALVAALLTSSQLLALDGIYSARQAALRESRHAAPASAPQQAPASPTPKPAWTVHGTDSPYDRTDPLASPLSLPRCTTSPSTPLPCLATVSADSRHVTVLEEDASLTGLDRR